jgi:hypothetical protein
MCGLSTVLPKLSTFDKQFSPKSKLSDVPIHVQKSI